MPRAELFVGFSLEKELERWFWEERRKNVLAGMKTFEKLIGWLKEVGGALLYEMRSGGRFCRGTKYIIFPANAGTIKEISTSPRIAARRHARTVYWSPERYANFLSSYQSMPKRRSLTCRVAAAYAPKFRHPSCASCTRVYWNVWWSRRIYVL